jgi:hypothetical protein
MGTAVIPSEALVSVDVVIRHAGWHYLWLTGDNSCRSWSRTSEVAIDKALTRALTSPNVNRIGQDAVVTQQDRVHIHNFAGPKDGEGGV